MWYIYISICVWVYYLTHIWMNYIRVCGDLFLSLLPLDFCGFSESVGLGRETWGKIWISEAQRCHHIYVSGFENPDKKAIRSSPPQRHSATRQRIPGCGSISESFLRQRNSRESSMCHSGRWKVPYKGMQVHHWDRKPTTAGNLVRWGEAGSLQQPISAGLGWKRFWNFILLCELSLQCHLFGSQQHVREGADNSLCSRHSKSRVGGRAWFWSRIRFWWRYFGFTPSISKSCRQDVSSNLWVVMTPQNHQRSGLNFEA